MKNQVRKLNCHSITIGLYGIHAEKTIPITKNLFVNSQKHNSFGLLRVSKKQNAAKVEMEDFSHLPKNEIFIS